MTSKKSKPRWWQLYVGLPLLSGLFVLEIRMALTGTVHIIAQLGILFLIYAYAHWWIQANRDALMSLDEENGDWQVRLYEFPAEGSSGAVAARTRLTERPMSSLPDAALKGVLSNTFDLDQPDGRYAAEAGIFFSKDILNAEDTKSTKV